MKKIIKSNLCGILAIFICSIFFMSCDSLDTAKKFIGQNETTYNASEEKETNDDNNLKVHFIDVGQADSILITQGKSSMLIDGGNNDDDILVKSYIEKQGITKLDYVVGTHAHEDHIGGLDYIINSFEVGKVYFPKQTANTKTFRDFVSSVKNKNMKFTEPKVGETFKLGEAECTILAPNSASYDDANDYSIVIKVTYKNKSFLFTGDAGSLSEKEMMNKGLDLKADVLKVGHHGSRTATTAAFLKQVSPKYAVVCVGKGNDYGHPTETVMNRLKNNSIEVYRTDENGTVIAESDGNNISFNVKPGSYKAGVRKNKQ